MGKINLSEVLFLDFSIDKTGVIFFWQNRVFRGIKKAESEKVKQLFESGLIEKLNQENLFPKSWITEYELEGFDLIVEHEKVENINYSHEWSFSMLKEIALTVLKINQIANQYGFQLNDIHSGNLVFDSMNIVFLDLGSFMAFSKQEKEWVAYRDFLENYYFPLKIWSNGNIQIARTFFLDRFKPFFTYEYILYKYPCFRLFKLDFLKNLINAYYRFRFIESTNDTIIQKRFSGILGNIICLFKKSKILPFQKTKYTKLMKKIEKLASRKIATQWKNYHTEIENQSDVFSKSRITRIAKIIKDQKIQTVVELAGNQGLFSKYLLENTQIKKAICTDYDVEAVDLMYQKYKKSNLKITPVILDFIRRNEVANSSPAYERFKSEAVMALAVTHHLILTQKIPLDYILKTIAQYSNKYVFVEFMPLGLWNGDDSQTPPLPDWYNLEWFRKHFEKQFNLIIEEKLEKNRVLFFGEIKK